MATLTSIQNGNGYRVEHEGRWVDVTLAVRQEPVSGLLVANPEMKNQYSVNVVSSTGRTDLYGSWSDDYSYTMDSVRHIAQSAVFGAANGMGDSYTDLVPVLGEVD